MSTRKTQSGKKPGYGPVIVSGNGPFDGLGLAFGGAVLAKKPARSKPKKKTARIAAMTIATGACSALLYFLLYEFQADIVRLADLTRQGVKIDFIVPIVIALVFSLVHGSFTERFWDLLGLKPKHE